METEFHYQIGDQILAVTVEREGDCFQVTVGENTYAIRAQRPEHGRLNLQIGDRRLRAYVAHDGLRRYIAMAGQTWTLDRPKSPTADGGSPARRGPVAGAGGASLEAAMPGLVLDVLVNEGDPVAKGDTLVLLEAMKMELRISVPGDGRVAKVLCQAGQVVERGQVLVEIEPVQEDT